MQRNMIHMDYINMHKEFVPSFNLHTKEGMNLNRAQPDRDSRVSKAEHNNT